MDINDLLKNETVQGLLKKAGVSDKQAADVLNQALSSVKGKFAQNPGGVSSLLSANANTEDDEKLNKEVENDFLGNLVKKVGLPESVASQVSSSMPAIMQQISGGLSQKGSNSQDGIAGMLSSVTDMFDGNSKKNKSKSGAMGFISSLFGK